MTPIRLIAGCVLLMPLACAGPDNRAGPAKQSSAIVDNMFVVPRSSDTSLTNLASGRFALQGRCLTLTIGDAIATPVFVRDTPDVLVDRNGLVIAGERFAFDTVYIFPGAGPPQALTAAKSCPAQMILINGIRPVVASEP